MKSLNLLVLAMLSLMLSKPGTAFGEEEKVWKCAAYCGDAVETITPGEKRHFCMSRVDVIGRCGGDVNYSYDYTKVSSKVPMYRDYTGTREQAVAAFVNECTGDNYSRRQKVLFLETDENNIVKPLSIQDLAQICQ
jgi:hypothetical protein